MQDRRPLLHSKIPLHRESAGESAGESAVHLGESAVLPVVPHSIHKRIRVLHSQENARPPPLSSSVTPSSSISLSPPARIEAREGFHVVQRSLMQP